MNGNRRALATCLVFLLALFSYRVHGQITTQRLTAAPDEPQNWLMYSGNYSSTRYSPLNQITPANVKNLKLQWVYQSPVAGNWQTSPLVVDGIMYITQRLNDVVALDATTGRAFWMYRYTPAQDRIVCCGANNRGLAILGDTLFMGTLDAQLIAIDAKTGHAIWKASVAKTTEGYSITHAPLVVKDKVIVGVGGGEYGIRGFIAAYDVKTGKEAWRFYTIPAPGEPGSETWQRCPPNSKSFCDPDAWKHGGGSIWMTGSYDAKLNLTYWGVGNVGPDYNGDQRPGDNLYTDSVVALDADTGKLRWHYQFTPHDVYDYDSVQVPVLVDNWDGSSINVITWANRNGNFYAIDRATGRFLLGKPFVKANWTSGLDAKGRPMNVKQVTQEGTLIYPGNQGGTNWYSPSFSPRTGLFYIPSWMDTYSTYIKRPVDYVEGQRFTGTLPVMSVRMLQPGPLVNRRLPEEGYGAIQAFDPKTGERKWAFNMSDMTESGVLTTASDLVFAGGRDGYFFALDAKTGALLWKASVGGAVSAGPMTYAVGGKQHVAISAGNALLVYGLRP